MICFTTPQRRRTNVFIHTWLFLLKLKLILYNVLNCLPSKTDTFMKLLHSTFLWLCTEFNASFTQWISQCILKGNAAIRLVLYTNIMNCWQLLWGSLIYYSFILIKEYLVKNICILSGTSNIYTSYLQFGKQITLFFLYFLCPEPLYLLFSLQSKYEMLSILKMRRTKRK